MAVIATMFLPGPTPSPWETYSNMLKKIYLQKDSLYPVLPETCAVNYIEPLLLKLNITDKPISVKDDLLPQQEQIGFNELFDIEIGKGYHIFIEGRPGSGKTMLVHQVSQLWANGSILTGCQILLRVYLRDLQGLVETEITPKILFVKVSTLPVEAIDDLYKEMITNLDLQEKLCFLLDGLDEYNVKGSIVHQLIFGDLFSLSTVIVTSRPEVITPFYKHAHRKIELVGFNETSVNLFIDECFHDSDNGPGKATKLQEYLASTPMVRQLCYIPLHLVFVVKVFFNSQIPLPSTITKIYALYVTETLKDEAEKFKGALVYEKECQHLSIRHLKDVASCSTLLAETFNELCKLAHIGVFGSKLVKTEFPWEAVPHLLRQRSLGMFFSHYVRYEVGSGEVYAFVHTNLQEFLAALYLSWGSYDATPEFNQYLGHAFIFHCGLLYFSYDSFPQLLQSVTSLPSWQLGYCLDYNQLLECLLESQSVMLVHEIVAAHDNKISICCDQYHSFPRLPTVMYEAGINFIFSSIHRNSLQGLEIGTYCQPNTLTSALDGFELPNLKKLVIWDDGRYASDATFHLILKQSPRLQHVSIITWRVNYRSARFTAEHKGLVHLQEMHIQHGDPEYNILCEATVISPTGIEKVNLCPEISDVDSSHCALDFNDIIYLPNLEMLKVNSWCPFDFTKLVMEEVSLSSIHTLDIEIRNAPVWNSVVEISKVFRGLKELNISVRACSEEFELEQLVIDFSLPQLEILSISSMSDCLRQPSVVIPTFSFFPSLSTFEVSNCKLESSFEERKGDIQSHLPVLHSIILHRSYISSTFGNTLSQITGSTATRLSITDAPEFGDQGLKDLLASKLCMNLSYLSMVNVGISTLSTNTLRLCFQSAINLIQLDLSRNEAINDHVIDDLFGGGDITFCKTLQNLNLLGTSVLSTGLSTLLKNCLKVAEHLTNIWVPLMDCSHLLQVETISSVKINGQQIFIDFMPSFKRPISIELTNCNSNPRYAQWLHLFLVKGSVFELIVRNCPTLSDDGINKLFVEATVCSGLEYLTFEGVGITDAAVSAIWWCMKETSKLRVLNLSGNSLTDKGVAELLHDPSVCKHMNSQGGILLYGNNLSSSGYNSLIPCLKTIGEHAS